MTEPMHLEEPAGAVPNARHKPFQEQPMLPFLKSAWYVVGWVSEFEGPGPFGRSVIDERVVFYRKNDGTLIALQDRCPHRWAPLSLGRVEGDSLRCMYHGLKISHEGGCLEVPGQDRVAKSLCARVYPVIEKYRLVWIWMGDSAVADPKLIPDVSVLDQTGRRLYCGQLDYEANYALINDNLLDLSHFGFLHEKTLGRTPEFQMQDRPVRRFPSGGQAEALNNGVRVEGWYSANSTFVPKHVRQGDLWSRVDFLIPGVYISAGGVYPAGTANTLNGCPPEAGRPPMYDSISIQAVTPITARKSRYFYSIGPRATDIGQEESDEMWAIVLEAFSEDLQMIQEQQKIIDTHPKERMGAIAADRGVVMFRNLMKKLVANERQGAGVPSLSGTAV